MILETVLVEREAPIAVVTLNRPPANAITGRMVSDLDAALDALAPEPALRAIVLTGAGDRIFCGGADLGAFAGEGEDLRAYLERGHALLRRIERFGTPVIAAIQGHATGGGCEIAMACHFRVMKETARIGQTESNLGILPGFGGTLRLPRLVGRTKAVEMLVLGTQISAAEALTLGLVSRVARDGETLADAKALARAVAGRAPIATRLILECVDRGLEGPLDRAIQGEIEAFLETLRTEDAGEGLRAFWEKRPPDFRGV
ncbi:MAG: enoyl-CoA hydratase [Candidatus Rokuibacteriota bacterium]|nr:MAG: enoyl-CoA hydratase [Candidatus Rokubacteria bacterium]